VKRFVTNNYTRAQKVLGEHKQTLLNMADALLARETLDADQVRRLAAGVALDEPLPSPAQNQPAPAPPDVRGRAKDRPAASIVPPISPRPVTQE
jgi:cell division protease FtsH